MSSISESSSASNGTPFWPLAEWLRCHRPDLDAERSYHVTEGGRGLAQFRNQAAVCRIPVRYLAFECDLDDAEADGVYVGEEEEVRKYKEKERKAQRALWEAKDCLLGGAEAIRL